MSNHFAWIQATCPNQELRNREKAAEHSAMAREFSAYGEWSVVDTLSSAHAEAGDLEEACRWAKKSLLLPPEEQLSSSKKLLGFFRHGRNARCEHLYVSDQRERRLQLPSQPCRETGTVKLSLLISPL